MTPRKPGIASKLHSLGAWIKNSLFTNRTARQTIAKNTFWLAVSNFGGRILRAFVIIYAARVLGAGEWGVFAYAVSLAALFTLFTDLGIGPVLTRETAKLSAPSERARYLSTSFFIKLLLLAAGTLVLLSIAPFFITLKGVREILPLVAFIFIFDTLRQFGFSLIHAHEKMQLEAGLYILTNIVIVAAGFLFLFLRPSVLSFAYAYALGSGVGMAGTAFVLREHLRGLFSYFSRALVKPILSSAWPFAVSTAMAGLMINVDILVIGVFRGAEEVGYYSAADRVIQLLYILPGVLAASTFPAISRIAGSNSPKIRPVLEQLLSFTLFFALPTTLVGSLVAPSIITFLFGAAYRAAGMPLAILFFTLIFTFPALMLNNFLFAANQQKKLLIFSAITTTANIVCDLVLIPPFGIAGSAVATLIAHLLGTTYLVRTVKRYQYFEVVPQLSRVIISTIVAAAVALFLLFMNVHLLTIIGAAGLSYLAVLFLSKEPLLKELTTLLRME